MSNIPIIIVMLNKLYSDWMALMPRRWAWMKDFIVQESSMMIIISIMLYCYTNR